MKRTAVIDIGTNSVKLTVADLDEDVQIVREESRITRLGRSVDSSGKLSTEAIQTTLEAVKSFFDIAKQAGATSVVAAGTSALRDASNGKEFLDDVKSACGLDVEIITGAREATLAFKAVVGDPSMELADLPSVLVFDIGGGSTELIWGTGNGVMTDHTSLNIGALRLTERHIHTDPPTLEELQSTMKDGVETAEPFVNGKGQPAAVCGVGGTASTLAAIVHSTKNVHGKVVTKDALEKAILSLERLPLAERKTVAFLDPERADIIVAGGTILIGLLNSFGASSYRVCLRGMRFGLLLEQKALPT